MSNPDAIRDDVARAGGHACAHPQITVVICTLGQRSSLRETVESVLSQGCDNVEVVVVINGPPGSAAPGVLPEAPARVVYEPNRGQCRARNFGIDNAQGEIVAFLDDDVTVAPGWLHAIIDGFAEPVVGAVTGPVKFEGTGYLQSPRHAERFYSNWTLMRSDPDWLGRSLSHDAGWGTNMAFRRTFLLTHKFPVDLGTGSLIGGGDEHYAFLQVLKEGYTLVHSPDAVVSLKFTETADEQRRRLKQMNAGTIAFYLKLLREERGHRWAILKRAILGAKNVTTDRHSTPPLLSLWEKLIAYSRGPLIYWKSRRRYGDPPR